MNSPSSASWSFIRRYRLTYIEQLCYAASAGQPLPGLNTQLTAAKTNSKGQHALEFNKKRDLGFPRSRFFVFEQNFLKTVFNGVFAL
ncbi:hypothetical protein CWC21_18995 [Pseudoalteromonas phenolica]|nr:hypothetical protein CWC21_18995 [Pseudoalteromonas phenolica]